MNKTITINQRALFFVDCMGSGMATPEEEVEQVVKDLKDNHNVILADYKMTEQPPFKGCGEYFDILFFDWGGMSIGNDMLGSFSRYLVEDAHDNPNKLYVMISSFTKDAVRDAVREFGKEKPFNIFYELEDFVEHIKKHGV